MKKLITILFAVALGLNLSAQTDCPPAQDANQDGVIGVDDLMDLLSHWGDTDFDFDGVYDSVDLCTDEGACNYLSNPTEACLYLDAIGVCGGDCAEDTDADGVCDVFYGQCQGESTLTYQGYTYDLVNIGEQCWFAENLNYNPLNSNWEDKSFFEARTYALPESFANGTPQGARYNFIAVEQLALCPAGWHVPSSEDIDVFENFLETTFPGGNEGLAIRNDSAWTVGTNESGFNAFPMPDYTQSNSAYWWTTFSYGYPDAEGFYQAEPYTAFARYVQFSRDLRFAVRCIKDTEE